MTKAVDVYGAVEEDDEGSVCEEQPVVKKKRHRRTKAELLKDPEYCRKHGIAWEGDNGGPKAKGKPEKANDDDARGYDESDGSDEDQRDCEAAPEEEPEAYEDDGGGDDEEYDQPEDAGDDVDDGDEDNVSVKPYPSDPFTKIYSGRWAFDVWDPRTSTCLHTQQLPASVEDYEGAVEETKKYCNRNLRAVFGCNIVIYEIHDEFRLAVTQVEIQR